MNMKDTKLTWFHVGADVPHQTTFKYWFAFMWGEWNILTMAIAILIILAWVFGWYECPWQIGIIGVAMAVAIGYFGFYKEWQDDKTN